MRLRFTFLSFSLFISISFACFASKSVAISHAVANAPSSFSMPLWFENFKKTASPRQMYQFLQAMPKGGDLHHHLSGSGFSEWWYELAADPTQNGGYTYYTQVNNRKCQSDKTQSDNQSPLRFHTISETTWVTLPDCLQQNYTELALLNEDQKQDFMDSIRLHTPSEGRDEFSLHIGNG